MFTPARRAADPPAEEKQQPKPATSTPAEQSPPPEAADSSVAESSAADAPARDAAAPTPAPSKAGSILDALKAKIPPQILPGFGSPNATASSVTDEDISPGESVAETQTESTETSNTPAESRTIAGSTGTTSEPADGQSDAAAKSEASGGWSKSLESKY